MFWALYLFSFQEEMENLKIILKGKCFDLRPEL